jgi:DNA repair protein RadC
MKTPAEYKIMRVRECAPTDKCEKPAELLDYWKQNIETADWFSPDREQLVVILLTTKLRCIGHHLISIGSVNETVCHPREVLRPAIVHAAHSFVVMHNHPSADASPSHADIRMTKILREASQLMQIPLLDHIIVGSETERPYFSFRESCLI